jgi:hypothetical protein
VATRRNTFYDVLHRAIADITENGFDQAGRIDYWTKELRDAATRSMTPLWLVEKRMRDALGAIYTRLVEKGQISKWHPGVAQYTVQKVAPQLRAELDRRIMASASLIKLNRQQAIEKTLQRFAGWATSIPTGGSGAVDRGAEAKGVRKALASLPFQERRVVIDQGHKLSAAVSSVVASGGGAIAMVWHSHWRQVNYNYREDHKERDGQVYLIRGSWAAERGLVRPGEAGWSDDITQPGEEVFCRCFASYIYSLRAMPEDMLTSKGRAELERVRSQSDGQGRTRSE